MAICEVDAVSKLAKDCGFHLEIAQEFERRFAHLWVGRLEPTASAPDAFLLAWQAADELDVIALGTAAEARCQGLARALVDELLQFAARTNMRRVILEVRSSNQAALRLYESFGFQTGRIREDYYSDPIEDGIEMSLAIDETASAIAANEYRCLEASE